MNVPQKHRDALQAQCECALTLTRNPFGGLLMFPRPVWEKHRERIAALPLNAQVYKRIYLGNATDVDIDSAGRILVPPLLRSAAQLEKEVSLLGMGDYFEIWDATQLRLEEEKELAKGLPESMATFNF